MRDLNLQIREKKTWDLCEMKAYQIDGDLFLSLSYFFHCFDTL